MAKCIFCDSVVPDNLTVCPNCGAAIVKEAPVDIPLQPIAPQPPAAYQQAQGANSQQPSAQPPAVVDSGSIGWGILGFFFPIVGWILYFVWRNTKPKSAQIAGIGGIVGFVLGMMINFL